MEQTPGVSLEPEEFLSLCNQCNVVPRKLPLETTAYEALQQYCAVEDRETGETIGFLWFNVVTGRWYWFLPDDVTEEIKELFI